MKIRTSSLKKGKKSWKPQEFSLKAEIKHHLYLIKNATKPKGHQKVSKIIEWLVNNTREDKVYQDFIIHKVGEFMHMCKNTKNETESRNKRQWYGTIPQLRLIECIVDNKVRPIFENWLT